MTHVTVTRRSGTSRGVSHLDVSVPDKKFLFEAISTFFGLPTTGVFILGFKECLLRREIFNEESHHSALNIDSTQGSGCLVCIHVALVFIPLVIDIISIITLILTLLKRILAVLQDKEMRSQIFPGVSRWPTNVSTALAAAHVGT